MNRKDRIALEKIVNEIDEAQDFISGQTAESFEQSALIKKAVCMSVINIGELIKVVSDDLRVRYPGVAWKEAAGFRDIAAHKYFALNMSDVYETVTHDFPVLRAQIREILDTDIDE